MKFCEKLKALREERGLSLSEMGNLLGTTKQVLSRYELGHNTPKITTVAHYAQVLGVSLTYFMNDDCTDRNAGMNKKNDQLVELIVRLRQDEDFANVVGMLGELQHNQFETIKQLLVTLTKQ